MRIRRQDGTFRWMINRGVPLLDGAGKAVQWFGTLTGIDVSHRLSGSRELIARG